MDLFDHLLLGASVAFSLQNLGFCLVGCLLGTLVGVLPGLGPITTIALLLPITFGMPPVSSLIMLSGIFYGAQYGGSTTAILVNMPGESSSVVTCMDGHKMALKGRAGAALTVAALGSFFAGSIGVLLVAAFGPTFAIVTTRFQSPEYFSLMLFGLVAALVFANGGITKAIASVVLGLLLGLVGTDINSGVARYTMLQPELADGINFVIVAMGLFGLADIASNISRPDGTGRIAAIGSFWPNADERRRSLPAVLRGTALGSFLGLLPGGRAVLASFASYALEKRVSKRKEEFGTGAVEAVAGPESANNAAAQTSFVPLLTLGIPSNPVMALLMGAMLIQGITPGPEVMTTNPSLFWGLIVSMWVGNLMLVIINLPLVGIWVKFLAIPYRMMVPVIVVVSCIGVYSINRSSFDITLLAIVCLLGYAFIKLQIETAPLILGFVLGPMMEESFRRSMILSRGSAFIFFERPVSLVLMGLSLVLVLILLSPTIRAERAVAFGE